MTGTLTLPRSSAPEPWEEATDQTSGAETAARRSRSEGWIQTRIAQRFVVFTGREFAAGDTGVYVFPKSIVQSVAIALTRPDSAFLAGLILNPPAPNEALRLAMQTQAGPTTP